MHDVTPLGPDTSNRELMRVLRTQPDIVMEVDNVLPESVLWRCFVELRKRGEPSAEHLFMRSVRQLHRRRTIGTCTLTTIDHNPNEHKLVDDPMLAELWKAYKRCICSQRTGPASQLLRDIEAQIAAA